MNLSVRNRLFVGFGVIIIIMIIVSISTYLGLNQTTKVQDRVINLRQPTVQAGMQLTNGINLSLAGLRGYMILGADPTKAKVFENERAQGWQEIDAAMATLRAFAKNWTVPANIEYLNSMETLVEEFRSVQQEVEGISHTNANIPSINILFTEAAPRAAKIISAITTLIDEESLQIATKERKLLLKLMADSRGSFSIGLANIRAYLLSGDAKFQSIFEEKWKINQKRATEIEGMKELFTSKQSSAWQEYQHFREEFAPLPEKMFTSRSGKEWNLANYWLGTKAAPKAKAIMKILSEMRTSQDKLSEDDKTLLEESSDKMKMVIIIFSVIALIVGLIIAFLIARAITEPLRKAVAYANVLANGDLTAPNLEKANHDEVGKMTDAMNELKHKLANIVGNINQATSALATAASQLNASVQITDQGMSKQRIEVELLATAMNEMTATVQEVAQNTNDAANLAKSADKETMSSNALMTKNSNTIRQLASSIEETSTTINKLGDETQSVDEVVGVINGIAEQTNLLALNAAIEAARAGEQGRGFAVVADEVRTLASRTQQSTVEISAILDRLKSTAVTAVQLMDEGHKQAQESVDSANTAADSLTVISQTARSINDMNVQIATASKEQSTVAEEMNRNIIHVHTETENISTVAHDTGEAAQEVDKLALQLHDLVSEFKTN